MNRCNVLHKAGITSWNWIPKPELSQREKFEKWEENERQALQASGLKTTRMPSDPIFNKYHMELQIGKSKYGKLQGESWSQYAAHQEELVKWMTAKQAALILEIPEASLYGLRIEEVEEAWARAYAKCTGEGQRHEVNAAAEHLFEYSKSHFAQERTKDHFTEKIMQTKQEVQQAISETNANAKSMLFKGLGIGHFIITAGFTFATVLMFRYLEKSDAQLAVMKAKRHFAHATCAVTNEEPAPDYQTRYRDTPTSLDERMTQPYPEITDPLHRQVLLEVESATKREELLLSSMSEEVVASSRSAAEAKLKREELRKAISNMSTLDMMDSIVRMAPPAPLRELRKL